LLAKELVEAYRIKQDESSQNYETESLSTHQIPELGLINAKSGEDLKVEEYVKYEELAQTSLQESHLNLESSPLKIESIGNTQSIEQEPEIEEIKSKGSNFYKFILFNRDSR